MSADNTVGVLRTPSRDGHGYEFRVADVQCIENSESEDQLYLKWWMVACFGSSQVFAENEAYGRSAEEQAWEAALAMAIEIRRDGCLDHGVRSVRIEQPFPTESAEGLRQVLKEKGIFPFHNG